jgi:hypothetical protein
VKGVLRGCAPQVLAERGAFSSADERAAAFFHAAIARRDVAGLTARHTAFFEAKTRDRLAGECKMKNEQEIRPVRFRCAPPTTIFL